MESVLGIRDDVTSDRAAATTARLASALRGTRCLLVLDTCEHLVGDTSELVRELSRSAPGVRWLATSREPLGLPCEHVYDVPRLSLPPRETPPGEDTEEYFPEEGLQGAEIDRAGLEGRDRAVSARDFCAVRLLATRAAASAPSFRLDRTTLPLVVSIYRCLDGLPLALELAARRVRTLGLRELAARLDDRFALLSSRDNGLPSRQHSLRAVIGWS